MSVSRRSRSQSKVCHGVAELFRSTKQLTTPLFRFLATTIWLSGNNSLALLHSVSLSISIVCHELLKPLSSTSDLKCDPRATKQV
jgi:hypothetical protein